MACEVLDALDHSHQHGIVHRDIKPSNIMLTGPTTVKVLDFGIAKALAEAATRLTGSGVAPGTPAYLSPEQISGVEIDHRADLYAMGCLLYELLTGAPPFQADSPFAVMHHHLSTEPVPLTRLRPQIPPRGGGGGRAGSALGPGGALRGRGGDAYRADRRARRRIGSDDAGGRAAPPGRGALSPCCRPPPAPHGAPSFHRICVGTGRKPSAVAVRPW
ncbi:serine/threonine-protein kinase [Streptomyces albospinus]|uniref:serine/threonine-protein kinase n=1 Tax=Streptomyces albospinus TaxID=285515 RepID=UPI001670B0B5|nr:serine/threonine-protein kinase [Streptomyces albospinus]